MAYVMLLPLYWHMILPIVDLQTMQKLLNVKTMTEGK